MMPLVMTMIIINMGPRAVLPEKISRCWSERKLSLPWRDVDVENDDDNDDDYDDDNDDNGDNDHRQKAP